MKTWLDDTVEFSFTLSSGEKVIVLIEIDGLDIINLAIRDKKTNESLDIEDIKEDDLWEIEDLAFTYHLERLEHET